MRDVAVSQLVLDALTRLLAVLQPVDDSEPPFRGHKRGTRLTVRTLSRLVHAWCDQAGLDGEFSSHTLRKTFGYTMRKQHGVDLAVIQELYGHASGRQTLRYVGITADELAAVYMLGVQ